MKMQMFVHRHYETIKLILIILIGVLTFFILLNQIQKNNQDSIDRENTVATLTRANQEVVESIQEEVNAQTVIMNRQFRALCIIILETSGEQGLARLDESSRQQCERLADNPELTEESAVEQEQSREQDNPPAQDNQENESSSDATPVPEQLQQDTSQNNSEENQDNEPNQPNMFQRFINSIRDMIESIL